MKHDIYGPFDTRRFLVPYNAFQTCIWGSPPRRKGSPWISKRVVNAFISVTCYCRAKLIGSPELSLPPETKMMVLLHSLLFVVKVLVNFFFFLIYFVFYLIYFDFLPSISSFDLEWNCFPKQTKKWRNLWYKYLQNMF